MHEFDKLELNIETLRELSHEELTNVVGGATVTTLCQTTTGPVMTVLITQAVVGQVTVWATDNSTAC